ncbi:mastin-like [Myotis lucifugus]|uniref:mastin-like n=1 Tax=Myotis lucifugus TaxID=59463 RepID=UPI000CCC5204|nr:mastin-like [Myotis lucifugus]
MCGRRNPVTRHIKVQLGRVRLAHQGSVQVARIIRHPKYSLEIGVSELLPPPYNLQEVEVPLVADEICQQQYGNVIRDDMLCAGSWGRVTCQGDSGGPLVCQWRGTWVQVGIVSWGYSCGHRDFPGVYARVMSYISCIRKYVPPPPGS